MIIIGSFGLLNDNIHIYDSLTADGTLHRRHHRLCHFDYLLDTTQSKPSSSCVVTLSSINIDAHPCLCKESPTEHVMDWNSPTLPHQAQKRQKAIGYISRVILDELHADTRALARVLPRDGSSDCLFDSMSNYLGSAPESHHPDLLPIESLLTKSNEPNTADLGTSPTNTTRADSYPTDGRERQKARLKAMKEKGIAPQKRKFAIEEVYDDCGSDLTGLGPDVCVLTSTTEHLQYLDEPDDDDEPYLHYPIYMFSGPDGPHFDITDKHNTSHTDNRNDLFQILASWPPGVDVIELCGGAGRVSKCCIRRFMSVGPNYDLVTDCDLNDPHVQQQVEDYLRIHKPLFV